PPWYLSAPSRPPGVLQMSDGGAGTGTLHRHDVEAIAVAAPAVSEDPAPRGPFDHGALLPRDRLHPVAADGGAPRLYLDERHQVGLPRHQVEVVLPQLPAMRLDPPAELGQALGDEQLRVVA